MASHYLGIADPSASKRLFLDSIARGCGALMMRPALIFDGVPRLTVFIYEQQVASDTLPMRIE